MLQRLLRAPYGLQHTLHRCMSTLVGALGHTMLTEPSNHSQAFAPEPWPSCDLPIAQASTPPSSWYTDHRTLPLEEATVFRNSWLLTTPGAFLTGQLLSLRYVVCRDASGKLGAFHNVCRHHAAAVAQGEGRCSQFECPYHGWTYGLDGRLLKATRLRGIADFKASDHGLVPLDVGTWGPLVFVRPGQGGGDVAAWLGEGSQAALGCGVDGMSSMRMVGRRTWQVPSNWKVVCDNYLDGGYHVPFAHKGLAGAVDMRSYTSSLHGRVSIQRCGTDGAGGGRLAGGRPVAYVFIYPNLMINVYGSWMDVNIVRPTAADACEVDFWYWYDGPDDAAHVEAALAESAVVQQEDVALCRAVQQGLASQAYDVGRYAPEVERPMFHFHRMVADDVLRN